MRRIRVEFAGYAHNLGQLGHKLRFVLQPSGCIDQDQIEIFCFGFFDRFIDEARGISARFFGEDWDARALTPDGQLFNRCSAKRVASNQQSFRALFLEFRRDLSDRRCFA